MIVPLLRICRGWDGDVLEGFGHAMKDADKGGSAAHRADHACLRDCTEQALQKYFNDLNGHGAEDVYAMVLGEIEPPLLQVTMQYCRGNQSRAAALLGISRSTLRKKLQTYQINL